MKIRKEIYQTECRCVAPGESKKWQEDDTTAVYRYREEAIEACLKLANKYRDWEYRVVRFDRGPVEVWK